MENYLEYGEGLATILAQLSPDALARVFGAPQMVLLSPGDSLNDLLSMDNVEFPIFSSTLPASSAGPLGDLAEFLIENPTATIEIEGHVSMNFGGAQSLSEARAESTKAYLVELGIDPGRIETVGKGYTEPVQGAGSANQRVEFTVVAP